MNVIHIAACIVCIVGAFAFGMYVAHSDPMYPCLKLGCLWAMFLLVIFTCAALEPRGCNMRLGDETPTEESVRQLLVQCFTYKDASMQMFGEESDLDNVMTDSGGITSKWPKCHNKYKLRWHKCDMQEFKKAIRTEFSCRKP